MDVVLEELLRRRVVLGHSWGAALALQLASLAPVEARRSWPKVIRKGSSWSMFVIHLYIIILICTILMTWMIDDSLMIDC